MAGTGITYAVEVAWGGSLEGLFRIGVSTIGGTDIIPGWPADVGFESVTADTTAFAVTRGRSSDLGQLMAGTATIRLRDQAGLYNPVNTDSALSPNVKPMRAIRIKATYDSTEHGLFYGFIQSIRSRSDPDSPVTELRCADLFSWLALRVPTISATGETTTGAAIGTVLDEIAWPGTLRSLGIGDTIPDFSASGTKTSLELIRELLEAEMGTFYINGSGIAVYEDRNERFKSTTVDSTITGAANTLMDFDSTNDASTIFNAATVTLSGGSAQSATDTDSINAFGRRDMESLTTTYLADDAAALSRAKLRVARFKDPKTPAFTTLLASNKTSPSQDTSAIVMARDLNDRVTITEPFGNTDAKQYFIEQVNHASEAHRGNQRHVTSWLLSEVPTTGPFIIGLTGIGQGYIGV
jgi:hypothetical protein